MSACPHCAAKDERIAWLESELGLQRDETARDKLRSALATATENARHGMNGTARFVLALYGARGRAMSSQQLLDAIPPRWGGDDERLPTIVRVWASSARKTLGKDAISTAWGSGYRLTPEGMARVGAILAA